MRLTRPAPLAAAVFLACAATGALAHEEHLRHHAPLPPSQVVRTVPRGGKDGAAPELQAANVPPIAQRPAAGDAITLVGTTLRVPD